MRGKLRSPNSKKNTNRQPNRAPKPNRRCTMKTLTIHTLVVAVAVALSGSPSMAAMEMSSLPVNQSETDTHRATTTTSSVPLYALNRLDAETLAVQAMTDQELKAVEGGTLNYAYDFGSGAEYRIDLSFLGTVTIRVGMPTATLN